MTDNPIASAVLNACTLIPGPVGTSCSVFQTAAYLVQGRLGEAAVSAIGIVAGGAVTLAAKAATAALKSVVVAAAINKAVARPHRVPDPIRATVRQWEGDC